MSSVELTKVDMKQELESSIQTLKAEHQQLESRLDVLDSQVYLLPAEEIERKDCQKLKLQKKDEIHRLQKKLAKLS